MTFTGNMTLAVAPGGPPPLPALSFCTGMAGDKAAFELAGIDCETVAVAEIDPLASAVCSIRRSDFGVSTDGRRSGVCATASGPSCR